MSSVASMRNLLKSQKSGTQPSARFAIIAFDYLDFSAVMVLR